MLAKSRSIGLDFGTSNCALAHFEDGRPRLIPASERTPYMPTALYFDSPRAQIAIDEQELKKRIAAAKGDQTRLKKQKGALFRELSIDEIERREREVLLREARRASDVAEIRSLRAVLSEARNVRVGEEAIRRYIRNPTGGHLLRSPKRFLGSELKADQLGLFEEVVTRILAYLKAVADRYLGRHVGCAVIGRPVTFSDTRGEEGDEQAIELMKSAADRAGFKEVTFLLEPVAAALDFERGLTAEKVALVVDVGGGTTDCSVVRLGPRRKSLLNRKSDVLGYCGATIGGTDIDESFAWQVFMPLFGKDAPTRDGMPLPYSLMKDALQVYDIPAQRRFHRAEQRIQEWERRARDPRLIERLSSLCRQRLSHRLIRSAELTKIALTDREYVTTPLDYIEPQLQIRSDRTALERAIGHVTRKIVEVAREAQCLAQITPDIAYVTGGTARSPVILAALRSALSGNVEIIFGDSFGSVVSGLAGHSENTYGRSRVT